MAQIHPSPGSQVSLARSAASDDPIVAHWQEFEGELKTNAAISATGLHDYTYYAKKYETAGKFQLMDPARGIYQLVNGKHRVRWTYRFVGGQHQWTWIIASDDRDLNEIRRLFVRFLRDRHRFNLRIQPQDDKHHKIGLQCGFHSECIKGPEGSHFCEGARHKRWLWLRSCKSRPMVPNDVNHPFWMVATTPRQSMFAS